MAPRPQPHRIEWPLNPEQVEAIDEMFEILFTDLRLAGTTPGAIGATGGTGAIGPEGPEGPEGPMGPPGTGGSGSSSITMAQVMQRVVLGI